MYLYFSKSGERAMEKSKKFILDMLFITIGSFIYVIGINYFIVSAHIFSSGLMGLAQESAETFNQIFKMHWTSTSTNYLLIQTISYWLMNLPTIYLGFKKVGIKFTVKTLIASFIIIPLFINLLVPQGSLLLDTNGSLSLASQTLSAIMGGILTGIGMGVIFRHGGSSGGTDIVATYLALFKGKSFGIYNLLINSVVMIWAVFLFGKLETVIMLCILIYVQSNVIDMIYNFQEKISLIVITKKEEELKRLFVEDLKRTYTSTKALSGYSQADSSFIYLVINKEEERYITKKIQSIDNQSFISTLNTKSVYGNFSNKFKERL